MPLFDILVAVAFILLVLALVLQPILQRRREDAVFRQVQEARGATEARALAEAAVARQRQRAEEEHSSPRSMP